MKRLIFSLISLALYSVEVIDWLHPGVPDFYQLQEHLMHGERPELDPIKRGDISRYHLIRKFRFIEGDTLPTLQLHTYHTDPQDKECCIITYSSCNKPYSNFPPFVMCGLGATNYKGHFLYQIGGWPYIQGGGLSCFDVPYAFKVCMFQEAMHLGYRYVLWIDVAAVPKTSLKKVFTEIKRSKGVFLLDPVPFANQKFFQTTSDIDHLAKILGSTKEALAKLTHLNAKLIGLDLFDEKIQAFINAWYALAREKKAFYNPVPEQLPLSFLAHQHNIIGTLHTEDFFHAHFTLLAHFDESCLPD